MRNRNQYFRIVRIFKTRAVDVAIKLILSSLFFSGIVWVPEPLSALAPAQLPQFEVIRFTLSNGLRVVLQPDSRIPMISYHTWYRVGSKDEQPGHTGAAHMLEHMMFKGGKKYSGKDFDRILNENGIQHNAFTSWDYTGFFQDIPPHALEIIIDLEMDRMGFLKLDPKDLVSEKQVVAEERRQVIEDRPVALMRENLWGLMFTHSPYRWPIIGYAVDIENYEIKTLRHFYESYYTPNNGVLVLVGNFDPVKTRRLIERSYSKLKAKELPARKFPEEPSQTSARRKEFTANAQTTSLMIGFPTVPLGHPDTHALDVLSIILGEGDSSRLSEQLRIRDGLVSAVSSGSIAAEKKGSFLIQAFVRSGVKHQRVEEKIWQVIEQLRTRPIRQEELEKARNQVFAEVVSELATFSGRARNLAFYELMRGGYEKMYEDLEAVQKVTLADLNRVSGEYLNAARSSTVILLPGSKVQRQLVQRGE
jgi:zinc protease